ncbi:MAG TPA: alpha/beta hydrolase [Burkholderiaceae bacterium]|nr:alpha/beta hydrolase [Burkholderiaceae bacterium]
MTGRPSAPRSERRLVDGVVGRIELAIDHPAGDVAGIACIGHPHPLYGGTLDNKVASSLARAFAALGWLAVRPNFRGVGGSDGTHDGGRGETDDFLHVIDVVAASADLGGGLPSPAPLALAGFSFGSFVAASAASRLATGGRAVEHLVLVGAAAGKWPMPAVGSETLVIHGENDETIPLSAVFDWARPLGVPVVVIPGADHFFHRRITLLKDLVLRHVTGSACRKSAASDASIDGERQIP